MELKNVLEYLRYNAPEIGRLRKRGDRLAARVFTAYHYCYNHRTSIRAQNELIRLVEEYIRRDVNISEREVLANRYGHKHQDDPIVIPDEKKVAHAVRSALRYRH